MSLSPLQIKNTHLNQAIHEEREAIIELRVQLRLLQMQRAQAPAEPALEDEEPEQWVGTAEAKPSPGRDRKETPI